MCMFCRSLFVLLYLFFWPLCCLFFFDIRILTTSLIHFVFKLFLLSIMTHSMSKYVALVHPRGFQWFFYQALMVCVLFGRSLFIFLSAFLPLYCYGRDRRGHDPMIIVLPITYAISSYNHWCLWIRSNLDQGNVYNIMWQCLSVTSNRSVVFSPGIQ